MLCVQYGQLEFNYLLLRILTITRKMTNKAITLIKKVNERNGEGKIGLTTTKV